MSQPGLSVVKCDHIYRDSKHTCNEYVRDPWFPATATGQSSPHASCKCPMGRTCIDRLRLSSSSIVIQSFRTQLCSGVSPPVPAHPHVINRLPGSAGGHGPSTTGDLQPGVPSHTGGRETERGELAKRTFWVLTRPTTDASCAFVATLPVSLLFPSGLF